MKIKTIFRLYPVLFDLGNTYLVPKRCQGIIMVIIPWARNNRLNLISRCFMAKRFGKALCIIFSPRCCSKVSKPPWYVSRWRPLQLMLSYFVRGRSITVCPPSCLIGLDSTKQVDLLITKLLNPNQSNRGTSWQWYVPLCSMSE